MGKNSDLYKKIDKILWKEWDPLGVQSAGVSARDEYQAYVKEILELLKKSSSAKEIAEYLLNVE